MVDGRWTLRARRQAGAIVVAVLLAVAVTATAQPAAMVEFSYGGRTVQVPSQGGRLELMPVLQLVGAEAVYSPAAGTYAVTLGEGEVQFTLERRTVLARGVLVEMGESPVPSPGGVAASVDFLEQALLVPLGLHLQPTAVGFAVATGSAFVEPVTVRPASADFPATTTVLLGLSRPVRAQVEAEAGEVLVVRFGDARPQLDPTLPLRSQRVRTLVATGRELRLELAPGVGLLSWHGLDGPPRVVLELGAVRPTPTAASAPVERRVARRPVVVDPGHGGDDTGATAADLMEKDIVLAVARRLQAILEARGLPVRLTRDGDEARALTDRTALANRLDAQAFISLHANASPFASVRGAETYYMSLDRGASDPAAAATARLENLGENGGAAQSPLDLILWDLAQTEVLNESARLALAVQRRLNERLGLNDRGVKQAPFVVLTGATMPAVLVEVGFLSNPEELQRLQDPAHQLSLAEAIAAGVLEFLDGR